MSRLFRSELCVFNWQAAEIRKQIEENQNAYEKLIEQWQAGLLSENDYRLMVRRNRDEYERLRADFEKVC